LYIKDLHLKYFRNYEKEEINFSPGICLIQGANGQGKSNLLEAIYNLCFAHSFRNLKESDLVYWNKPFYYLQGTLCLQQRFFKVEVGYDLLKKRKVVKINGRNVKQFHLAEYCPVVFFLPEDLELVRRGPEERRRFLDREISQESRLYGDLLSRYNRVVFQKNQVLKEKRSNKEIKELTRPWNKQMVYFGSRIIQKRAQVLSTWSTLAAHNYSVLFKYAPEMKIVYNNFIGEDAVFADIEEIENRFYKEISSWEEEEFKRGFSLLGPHRDDLTFLLDGRDARRFASHGQQRSAVIALKAAQIQSYNKKNEKPLFILDDVFSELDEWRKQQCFLLLRDAEQVFLTITKKDSCLDTFLEQTACSSFLHVQEGKILEINSNGKNSTIC
jgi:DNA replication and repair protein RecF